MLLNGVKIGLGITGCVTVVSIVIDAIKQLIEDGAEVIPIMSYYAYKKSIKSEIEEITNKKIIHTIQEAEHIASKKIIDIMLLVPCTGNTIAKIANGIADTPVTVCAKYCLANENNIVIGIYVADGLSSNASNIGRLLNTKNIYFIPFRQPNPITKPNLISFDKNYIINTTQKAIIREQIQPLLL